MIRLRQAEVLTAQGRSVVDAIRVDRRDERASYGNVLKRLSDEFGLRYLPIDNMLCSDKECGMSKGGSVLYRDNNHLNIVGSKIVGEFLAERLSLFSGKSSSEL